MWIQNYTYDLLSFHQKVNNFHSGNPNKGIEMSYNVALNNVELRAISEEARGVFSLYLSSKMRLVKIQVLINFEIYPQDKYIANWLSHSLVPSFPWRACN